MIIGVDASSVAIERAFRERGSDLIRVAMAATGGACSDDAQDAAAYAFSVLARRPDVLESESWWGWCCTVAVNECRRIVRERSAAVELVRDLVSERDPISDLAARQELAEALGRVPEDKRREFLLQAAGYSYAEIARMLGVTYTHVNRSVTEGRAHARGELSAPRRLPAPRGTGAGRRYHPRYRAAARRLRLEGHSYPQICRMLGCSLRTAMVWTAGVRVRYLRRRCAHCNRDFQWPVVAHGVPKYCTPRCARYAYSLRRPSRARS